MAFANVGTLGNTNEKTSDGSIVLTAAATAEVGNLVVVGCAMDNVGTSEAETTQLSIADSAGNTWTKMHEKTMSAGAANDGVVLACWATVVTSQIDSGSDTITVTTSSNVTAKAMFAHEFTLAESSVAVEQLTSDGQAAASTYTASLSSMTSREYLLLHFKGSEGFAAYTTLDSDYTVMVDGVETTGGSAASNIATGGARRIATLTDDTISNTYNATRDRVDIFLAVYEVAGGGTEHFGSASLALTVERVVAGKRTAKGAAAAPFTLSVAAAGKRTAKGAATAPFTLNVATAAKKTAKGATTVPLVFAVDTAGAVPGGEKFGALSLPLTLDTATVGRRTAKGAASLPLTFAADVSGTRTAKGAAALTFTVGAATGGSRTAYASATVPLTFTFDIAGANPSAVPVLLHFAQPTPGGGVGAGSAAGGVGAGTPAGGVGSGSPSALVFAQPAPETT